MKAAIYNPYLDSLGGGERYTISFAKVLSENGYSVDLEWRESSILKKLEVRFGMDLNGINIVSDIKRGDSYDLCFWLSDGSIPLLRARKNILHFQFPFSNINGRSLLNRMKLFRINKIVCNSFFTKGFIDKEFAVDSTVIYPPVDAAKIRSKRKENIIVYVGRFSQLEQAKNQHILIESFKKLYKKGFSDWSLVLAGGAEVGVGDYLKLCERKAKGYPIRIIKSPKIEYLYDLYGKAKIFWSAVGYKINEDKYPTKVEHFGISLVEAMAGGCVPIVYQAGGYKEIVAEGFNGFFWKKKGELVKKTINLINERKEYRRLVKKVQSTSKVYDYERFAAEVTELL